MGEEEQAALVVDNGSGMMKAGFSGDDLPRAVFPTVVGRPKTVSSENKRYVGDNAKANRDALHLSYPMEYGCVCRWDDMDAVWYHTFHDQLHAATEDLPILLTQALWNSKAHKEKIAAIMFENYSVPAMYISSAAVLSLYASGHTTGLALDSGLSDMHAVAVCDGYALPHSLNRSYYGGKHLTDYMQKILNEGGCSFTTAAEREIVRDIKEKLAYVPLDVDAETDKYEENTDGEKTYALPDGTTIKVGTERFRCGEAFFNCTVMGTWASEHPFVHQIVDVSIRKCDRELRKFLYGNIVMSGGGSMLPGTQARLMKEMTDLVMPSTKVSVVVPPDCRYSAWRGGSILASLTTFQDMWVTKEEWDDEGGSVVHRKCW